MDNYEESINALIPAASKEARKKVEALGLTKQMRQGVNGLPFTWDFFTEYFHAAMNRMAAEQGLRGDRP